MGNYKNGQKTGFQIVLSLSPHFFKENSPLQSDRAWCLLLLMSYGQL